ncbi:hypothetical protein BGW80DRAFT_1283920 [Lactifluus volemus]|nr:hypothetical protein BGW80DRAFT_1283920 [Lactifluus volemus]
MFASPLLPAATPPKLAPRKSLPSTSTLAPSVNHLSRAAISLEYASLRYQSHCPLGMYVIPFVDDPSIWDAVLFIHQGERRRFSSLNAKVTPRQGYYTDSILKFLHFVTDVFHPLISHQDGTFNLALKFHPWRPNVHHVYDILYYIKASFKKHTLDQIKESDYHPSMANTKGPPHTLIFRELKPEQSGELHAPQVA